jgi:hypothetical protein
VHDSNGFPRMLRVRQQFDAPRVRDIAGEVRRQLDTLDLGKKVRAGQTVAITAGSRGIANIALVIKSACDHVRALGGRPVIIPAMGSHGGGTAEGQRRIIEGYGVTEGFTGGEIRASMETVVLDTTPQGIPVHFDKHAFECDHVLVVGRVKPHTGFVGPVESGLHKMMLIGLGKHAGAKIYHRAILDFSFPEIIGAVADVVLRKGKVVGGLALVENAYDETGLIAAVAPGDFFRRESELLTLAKQWLPRLPFAQVQLLIIDAIGKNVSGTGMDTNVIGRKYNDHAATDEDGVSVKRIYVRGLTAETHGNATGIGLAEFTNTRTVRQIDSRITAINCLTGGHPTAAMVPIAYDTDREVIAAALPTLGLVEPSRTRVVQIADTLHLAEVLVSEAYLSEVKSRNDLEILAGPFEMPFDHDGNLEAVGAGQHAAALGAVEG